MLEDVVENALVAGVEDLGGECRKGHDPGRRGAPDREIFLFGIHLFVETKTKGGKVEPWQERYHVMLRKHGQRVEVIWNLQQVENLLGELREALNA